MVVRLCFFQLLQVLGHCSEFAPQEIALFIFTRINDLARFWDVILPFIPPTEQRAVQHRVGMLNLFNPSTFSAVLFSSFHPW